MFYETYQPLAGVCTSDTTRLYAYTVCITYRLQYIFYVSISTCCDFLSSVCPLQFFSCRSLCNFSPVPIEFHTWWSPGVVFPSWTFEFPQILLHVEGFHFHIPDRKIDFNHLCCYKRKPKLNYLYLNWIALSVLNCSSWRSSKDHLLLIQYYHRREPKLN